jgi:mono/diheme cytochrome c family protein
MKKVFKWIGIVLGAIIGLILLVVVGLYIKGRAEFSRKYDVNVESVAIPTDAASLARGQHLATILCAECHEQDLGGNPDWFDGGGLGSATTPNLTTGKGGLGNQLADADFIRVLRHGVKPDGTSVFIMPSQDFHYMSDADLGALIAYIRSVAPVDRVASKPQVSLSFMGNVLYGAGMFGHLLRADVIDHTVQPTAPQPGVTAEYGQYLVNINGCHDCHGAQLAGGKPGAPNSPLAPNLTPGGELAAWSEADFLKALHTGVTPAGTNLRDEFMPWKFKGQMTDDELKTIWANLQSLPKLPTSTAPAE